MFLSSQAFAQVGTEAEDIYHSRISEYFYNKSGRDVLSPVKLLGSVSKPGLYHLPENTNLSTLLSIAGGTAGDANLKGIVIRRADGSRIERDLLKVVQNGDEVKLATGDIIFVPQKEGWFDGPTSNSIMVVTAVLTVVLTGIMVQNTIRTTNGP